MSSLHNSSIVDQFTRQAVPFSTAASIRDEEALQRIVRAAGTGPDDTVLDVACGPGLLACAFARAARHATGIDLTPAMLDRARKLQQEQALANLDWRQGDVTSLPFADGSFSIVSCRFAFHHFLDPLAVLREMRRVVAPGGRVAVADSTPVAGRADAFNAMEKLRDPSHTRALPPEEMHALFAAAGLPAPSVSTCRVEFELEDLLARSFPNPGDAEKIRALFRDSLHNDALDMAAREENGRILTGYPVSIFVSTAV